MRIEINTNGFWDVTSIKFNGKEQKDLREFNFSIKAGSKPKLQMVKDVEKIPQFISYFGADFQKYDEYNKEN